MNKYEFDIKVNLTIPVVAESYEKGLKQIEVYLESQDIVSDFEIIDVDCYEVDSD